MTFSEQVKNEILENKMESNCCLLAMLSAFIRGSGTISQRGGYIGFEITTESKITADYFSKILEKIYGVNVIKTSISDRLKGKQKYTLDCVNNISFNILQEIGILSVENGEVVINLNIDKYLIENDCCKKAYIKGAFIGSGSVTVPKVENVTSTSYHLEFVFSKYQTATDFCVILSEQGFMPKLIERKQNFIVYIKNAEEICDMLVYLGAKKSRLFLTEVIVEKEVRNATNRQINCEMGNLSKQIDASIKQRKSINLIKETIGLDGLNKQLKDAIEVRLNNPDATLDEMAKILNVSKSCLNHRLRKIIEIAENLK